MEEDIKHLEDIKENFEYSLEHRTSLTNEEYLNAHRKSLAISNILNELDRLQKENEQLHKFILEGITIENSPFQNYQLDILMENFIPIWRIKNLIKELKQDDINMTRKYKEKKNITGELLGIDKVRVRAYREKTREIKEKLQKLLSDWEKGK